jgi:hypothetical protein
VCLRPRFPPVVVALVGVLVLGGFSGWVVGASASLGRGSMGESSGGLVVPSSTVALESFVLGPGLHADTGSTTTVAPDASSSTSTSTDPSPTTTAPPPPAPSSSVGVLPYDSVLLLGLLGCLTAGALFSRVVFGPRGRFRD